MAGSVVAARVIQARQRIVEYFTSAGAVRAEAAILYRPRDHRIDQRIFARLVAFGALVEAGEGRYWLSEKKYADFRKQSLANVLGALALAGFAAAGALALG